MSYLLPRLLKRAHMRTTTHIRIHTITFPNRRASVERQNICRAPSPRCCWNFEQISRLDDAFFSHSHIRTVGGQHSYFAFFTCFSAADMCGSHLIRTELTEKKISCHILTHQNSFANTYTRIQFGKHVFYQTPFSFTQ